MQPIPVARPTLGEEEAAAARRAILSGWVVQGPEVEAFEKEMIIEALKKSNGISSRAAQELGLTQRIMNYKIDKYGIEPRRFKVK